MFVAPFAGETWDWIGRFQSYVSFTSAFRAGVKDKTAASHGAAETIKAGSLDGWPVVGSWSRLLPESGCLIAAAQFSAGFIEDAHELLVHQ